MSAITEYGVQPRRRWPLWLVLIVCVLWFAAVLARGLPGATGPAGGLALAIAALPPLALGLFVAALVPHAGRRADLDDMEMRLANSAAGAGELEISLRAIAQTLSDAAARTDELRVAASEQGQGLGASAAALRTAAAEVVRAGGEAERTTAALNAAMPGITRQASDVDALVRRLGNESAQQVRATETLLGNVRTRGAQAAQQADAEIAGMTKLLAEIDQASQAMTSAIAKRAYALDAAVDGVLERTTGVLDTVGARVTEHTAAMEAQLSKARAEVDDIGGTSARVVGQRLDSLLAAGNQLRQMMAAHEEQTGRVLERTDTHIASLPGRLTESRQDGEAAMDALVGRIGLVQAHLGDLRTPFAVSNAAMEALGEQLGMLRRNVDELGGALDQRLPATAEQLNAFAAGTASLSQQVDTMRDTLGHGLQVTHALGALVESTRQQLRGFADEDAVRVGDRLGELHAASGELADRIDAHGPQSERMRAMVEADLGALLARLRTVHEDSNARMEAMGERVIGVQGTLDDLSTPLRAARATLGDVEGQLAQLTETAADLDRSLDARLPATAIALEGMSAGAAALIERIDSVKAAIAGGAVAIDGASDTFAREREALVGAAQDLARHFDHAHEALGALRADTGTAANEATGRLGPAFDRVRELAEESSAALRALLADVIADTESALDRTGAATAEAAFGAPIRIQLAAIEEASGRAANAAEAAAQRVSGQARALSATVEGVEAKVAEIETRLDVRARDTLTARSTRLIEMLNEASVDVARLLSIDAGEKAWLKYLKGDRSIFARLTVRLIDRETTRKIARHYEHDVAFNNEASRYLDLFESLTQRLLSDPDGEALTATIVSSDLGKLYVAIARATGRWNPLA